MPKRPYYIIVELYYSVQPTLTTLKNNYVGYLAVFV